MLQWEDSNLDTHDETFERIFAGDITVAGGDGFVVTFTQFAEGANAFPYIDAVVLDFTAAPVPFVITEIEYDADAEPSPTVTLTWRNSGAASYIAKYSLDMTGWGADMGDGLTAVDDERPEDTDHITMTFPLTDSGLEGEGDVFFRVEEE